MLQQNYNKRNPFDKQMSNLLARIENYRKDVTQPEHAVICNLFDQYSSAMRWFYSEGRYLSCNDSQMEEWRQKLDWFGVQAYRIYQRLKQQDIHVLYDKNLIKNRLEDCAYGPDKLEFHLHNHSIEDLLNWAIAGTSNQEEIEEETDEDS
jgi:hypothetical protein